MSTCKAKIGEYSCGLLPLRDGLCDQHFKQLHGNKPVEEKCSQFEWPPQRDSQESFANRIVPETSGTVHEQHSHREPIQMDYSNYQLYNPQMDVKKNKKSEYNVQAFNQ